MVVFLPAQLPADFVTGPWSRVLGLWY